LNIEELSQILDAASFILVTPEFLGEARLDKFRLTLGKYSDKISYGFFAFEQGQSRREYITAILTQIIGTFVFAVIFWLVAEKDVWWAVLTKLVAGFMVFSGVVTFTASMIAVFLIAVQNLAVRGILFAIGSLTFFTARAIMFWAHSG
jgi:hypothetical protein